MRCSIATAASPPSRRSPACKEKFVGGLRLPQDETGDCHMFTQALAAEAAKLGVQFKFNTGIERLVADGDEITGVVTSAGLLQADAYVVALGSWSSRLLQAARRFHPGLSGQGLFDHGAGHRRAGAPVSTVMDESYKVAITRLGDRIRVGGTAEISGYSDSLDPARRATLDHSLTDLFPRGGDLAKATFWCGLRPMTPDGPPVIGATRYANLHLNTGHGTLGWTMACGSGRVLADLLSGRKPEIDVSELTLAATIIASADVTARIEAQRDGEATDPLGISAGIGGNGWADARSPRRARRRPPPRLSRPSGSRPHCRCDSP